MSSKLTVSQLLARVENRLRRVGHNRSNRQLRMV